MQFLPQKSQSDTTSRANASQDVERRNARCESEGISPCAESEGISPCAESEVSRHVPRAKASRRVPRAKASGREGISPCAESEVSRRVPRAKASRRVLRAKYLAVCESERIWPCAKSERISPCAETSNRFIRRLTEQRTPQISTCSIPATCQQHVSNMSATYQHHCTPQTQSLTRFQRLASLLSRTQSSWRTRCT
jgi:hypothetical protein